MKIAIEYDNVKGIVEFKELTFGEKNNALREATKIMIKDKKVFKDVDNITYEEYQLLYSIVKAPFEISIESLRKLPSRIGDQLYAVFKKIHRVEVPKIVD